MSMVLGELVVDFVGRDLVPHVIAHVLADVGIARYRKAMRARSRRAGEQAACVRVLSAAAGRVRLLVPDLDDATTGNAAAAALRDLPGVATASANPRTRSILVYYDPARLGVDTLVAALSAPTQRATPPKTGRGWRSPPQLDGACAPSLSAHAPVAMGEARRERALAPSRRTWPHRRSPGQAVAHPRGGERQLSGK